MSRSDREVTRRWNSKGLPLSSSLALLLVFAMCIGCVARPRLEQITPPDFVRVPNSHGTVSVSFNEGIPIAPDDGMGKTISREMYVEAVAAGLVRSGLFARVVPAGQSDFHLEATLTAVRLNVVDRSLGYVLAYDVVAEWKLTRVRGGEVLFHKDVSGTGRANFGDAFNGITRNTLAREQAAKSNISAGLLQLSKLSF